MRASTSRLALGITLIVVPAVLWHGIPVLRHDWSWPLDRPGVMAQLWDYYCGWHLNGIGSVNAYPTDYLIVLPMTILSLTFGPFISLALFLLFICFVIAVGAERLAKAWDAHQAAALVGVSFAMLNPWVYTKIVAGHLFMVLAYGALLWLIGDAFDSKPRRGQILQYIAVALTLQQLQFFLFACLLTLAVSARRRSYAPFAFAVVIGMPVFIGLFFDRWALLQTPYFLPWQMGESVSPGKGILLLGYFAGYTNDAPLFQAAMSMVILAGVVGVVVARGRTATWLCVVLLCVSVLVASGLKWWFAPVYTAAVLHAPVTGILRELYDVLALAAYAFTCLLLVRGNAQWFRSGIAALGCALLAVSWIVYPPNRFWPASWHWHSIAVNAPAKSRFLLLPALQPLSFGGLGAGEDYDAYARSLDVTPLNEYLPTYPVDAAIARYQLSGDTSMLGELSVSRILPRPWLQTNADILSVQRPFRSSAASGAALRLGYQPIAEFISIPRIVRLPPPVDSGAVFFLDSGARGMVPSSDKRFVDPRFGWVDASFIFLNRPKWAEGVGGVYTISSVPLLVPERAVLLRADAAIQVNGRPLIVGNGWRWIDSRAKQTTLICRSACLVVAGAPQIPRFANTARSHAQGEALLTYYLPWLAHVELPPSAGPLELRYNVRYDPHWAAFAPGRSLTHVRLDSSVNGWYVPPARRPRSLWIIHTVSAAQFLFESLIVISMVVWAFARLARSLLVINLQRNLVKS